MGSSSSSWNLAGIFLDSDKEFWRERIRSRWATLLVLLFIVVWKSVTTLVSNSKRLRSVSLRSNTTTTTTTTSSGGTVTRDSKSKISDIVSDVDLTTLLNNLEGKFDDGETWDDVVDRRNDFMSYNVKSCKPKEGPLKYLSVTVFEGCSVEVLRDFYMDNEYRIKWDSTMVAHEQLQVDEGNGTEIGRMIKKFPLLTQREYVLAWRLWEGKDNTFYCFSKECEHVLAPHQKKYVRVRYFRSGWRIRKVPGRDACEIKMVHQEDAGLNVEMAKLAFSRGIWSYVCKMDGALRKYSTGRSPSTSARSAVTLMQKVPPELDSVINTAHDAPQETTSISTLDRQTTDVRGKKLYRRPSKKMIANGLLLLGGVVCLSRGHSNIGAKVAIACILKKLTKNGAASGQIGNSRSTYD